MQELRELMACVGREERSHRARRVRPRITLADVGLWESLPERTEKSPSRSTKEASAKCPPRESVLNQVADGEQRTSQDPTSQTAPR